MTGNETLLSGVRGGRVLDACCGAGRFTRLLAGSLSETHSIIGVDTSKDGLDQARRETEDPRVTFRMMDVMEIAPAPPRYDTVAIGYSLHHVPDPGAALRLLVSVLEPGGTLIVNEPCRDGLSAAQRNGRDLHHLKARIDRLRGIEHRTTYDEEEILALVRSCGVEVTGQNREDPRDDGPHDDGAQDEQAAEALEFLAQYSEFAKGLDEYAEIIAAQRSLAERIAAGGIASPAHLLVIARKPPFGD